jgi:hypothetical protein
MSGFNYISAEGVIEFWQLLHQQGTIDLLQDMKPKTKINALMQSENFDLDAHIKTNYMGQDYDDVVAEMLDEVVETIITLECCFIFGMCGVDFKGRSFKNLDSIPESAIWSPSVYLPLTCDPAVTLNETLKDASNWLCDRGDETNCNYFLSPCPEAGPYAIIHFMEDGVNTAMVTTELNHNFGAVLTFAEQDAHTITVWTKEN